jgi:hypothetical protein
LLRVSLVAWPTYLLGLISCETEKAIEKNTLFFTVPSDHSNIDFANNLNQSDDFNIIEYLYYYNGAGVSIGDVNNDGLADIYFSANQSPAKLYLNKGDFKFEDITDRAGVAAGMEWKTGVTMADVNGDGWLDIFVCGVGGYKHFNGRNQLFINNHDLTFSEQTDEYGLSFKGFSTQASFFDYDNDGDLDMYLANHAVHTPRSYGPSMLRFQSDPLSGDKLYRNELVPGGRNFFTEVTSKSGILNSQIGYALAVGVSDFNLDGYSDIYVSNDFNENDYLYINQKNGTFIQQLEKSMPHSSRFSMGNDIGDINNDGLTDIITLDMLPKDEEVIKTTAGDDPYEIFAFKLHYGYHYQFSRNALQLNRGFDSNGEVIFSDIAPYAGIEATDWSWAALLADFDNDGNKDVYVANGIAGRPNDLDYINYISTDSAQRYYSDKQLIAQMPSGKVPNVFYRNRGNLSFEDVSASWTKTSPNLSNGAAYSDLDNDGDLDLVVNNINEKASVFRNDLPAGSGHYLKIKLEGTAPNKFGIGATITVYTGSEKMYYEQYATRGWMSSVDPAILIGLGQSPKVDSLIIRWPDQKAQTLRSIEVNQTLVLQQSSASANVRREPIAVTLLSEEPDLPFSHRENNFIAFSTERLIPHMLSTQGPKIAVGDVNRDGLEDFFVGGASGQPSELFLQNRKGEFLKSHQPAIKADSAAEDIGAAFLDANGDGSTDLVVVGGGQQLNGDHDELLPRLYVNNGKGQLIRRKEMLPRIFVNASCVKPGDADNDGDIDLFIGGRVIAGQYGMDPPSYLLINDGKGQFTDASSKLEYAEGKHAATIGMVTDAVWVDVNKDKRTDLVLTGEWMPITVLIQNESGVFDNKTKDFGVEGSDGWWNTIVADDFDKDGDIDLVAGNFGHNSRLRAKANEPVSIYVGDIDNNNSLDQILTYYNNGVSFPFISRDQLIKQVPSLKRKFLKFENYRNVSIEDIIAPETMGRFIRKNVYTFSSVYLENNDGLKFTLTDLPADAQLYPVFAICVDDVNLDGNKDLLLAGNLDAVQPDIGRYDAGYGSVLLGDGKGNFETSRPEASGLVVRGDGRDIKALTTSSGKKLFLFSLNNNAIKVFKRTK